jgi:hypothetical protein
MNMIDSINSVQDLLSLRDHIGKVMGEAMNLPLKSRKLNELTAKLIGAQDFNTAQAIIVNKEAVEAVKAPIDVVIDVTHGDYLLYSGAAIRAVIIDRSKDEVGFARENDIPNLIDDFFDGKAAFWMVDSNGGSESDYLSARHYIDQAYDCIKPEPYFPARITSDDGDSEAEFNAYPYFRNLKGHAEIALAIANLDSQGWTDGWSGSYASDEVAEALRSQPGFENVAKVFNYIDAVNDNAEQQGRERDMGFSVWVDSDVVREWFNALSGDQKPA